MNDFTNKGFSIIRNLVKTSDVTRLYGYTLQNHERGNMNDGQVPGSASFYQDKEIVRLAKELHPLIEKAIEKELLNVFCYHRVYRTGAILKMHKDSARAEISATINLGQKGDPWDLWLLDYEENAHKVILNPGDALIYHGMKLHHWRGKLVNSDFVSQIMFHFVDKHGKHKMTAKTEIFRKIRKKMRQLRGLAY